MADLSTRQRGPLPWESGQARSIALSSVAGNQWRLSLAKPHCNGGTGSTIRQARGGHCPEPPIQFAAPLRSTCPGEGLTRREVTRHDTYCTSVINHQRPNEAICRTPLRSPADPCSRELIWSINFPVVAVSTLGWYDPIIVPH
jgi:hypothetical protein